MGTRHAAVMAGLALALMSGTAKAAYIFNFEEVGSNVVLTGSGSLNLAGSPGFSTPSGEGVVPSSSIIYIGTESNEDVYGGLTGPSSFGTGGLDYFTSTAGDYVGLAGSSEFFVPAGYVSGTQLLSSGTFANASFTSLGLDEGRYVYNLASDKIIVDVGVSGVPLPSSAPMFGAALMALGAISYGVKRKKAAATA